MAAKVALICFFLTLTVCTGSVGWAQTLAKMGVMTVGGGVPAAAASALYTNAIAVFDFENNANDTKGVKNLTAGGDPVYGTTGEAQGTYWVTLNGDDDRFSVTDSAFRFSGDFSISMWATLSDTASFKGSFACCYDNTTGNGWELQTDGTTNQYLRLYMRNAWTLEYATFEVTLSKNTRYHIVVAYSDSGNKVTAWVSTSTFGDVINGTEVTMSQNAGVGTGSVFYIGYNRSGDSYHKGSIDEAVFWASAITATDAEAIFNARDGGTSWR